MNENSPGTDTETKAPSTGSAGRESIGELLAQTRQKSGQDIPDVAQSLRISQRYLEAIEEGRNDDLPGTTYAVGFVRSYAEYLGLDEDEIVRRYKDEAEGLEATSELTFPKPIPEGGVPGGVVLLVGALVALIAYGVWYMNSEDQNTPVAQVDAVPERLEVASNKQSATPQEGNVVSKDAVIARSEPVAKPEPEPEPEPQPEPEPEPQAEPETAQEAEPEPETVTEMTPETVTETVSETTPETVPEVEPASAPVDVAVVVTPEPFSEPVAPPSRITVRAISNSWIQIRDDAQDKLLFTRLLRKDDTYDVPDRPNLRLLTGNAGALEVLVDGKVVPSIGETGDVRRNVALDPELLIDGKAVTN